MKFHLIIEIFKERMAGAHLLPIILVGFVVLLILLFVLWRWGAGFLMALAIILTGLQLTRSNVVNGLVLMGRFVLVVVLAFHCFLSQKNKRPFSPVIIVLLLLPFVMFINSARAPNPADAVGQSMLFLLFYVALIVGGRKILGDARGRATFVKALLLYVIVMTCLQVPYWSTEQGRFKGSFEHEIGFMVVGMAGVIILFWSAMKQKIWSPRFFLYIVFTTATFIFMIITAGRTVIGGSLLGILVILARKLKRNVVIFLAASIILGPLGIRIITSYTGFEAVKSKFLSRASTGRAALFALAWQEIKVKPVLGWGTQQALVKAGTEAGKSYHQSYLQFAVDHGIPFALVMMFLFVWFPFRGLYLMRNCHTEELKDMANLSSAFLAAYVFSSFLGNVLLATTFALPIYSMIALQEGVWAENKEIELYGWLQGTEEDIPDAASEEMLLGEPLLR